MRSIIIFLFALAAGSLSAQTLEDYLKIAAENNPGIRAKQTEVQAALQKLPQAKALPDPTVNASWFVRPMMLPMGNQLGSISAMQMFPWFGALDAMENEAARMAEVKLQAVQVAQNELFFKVKNGWYPLFELEEQIRIQQDLLRLLETDKELATVMFQQGMAPMVDPIRADIMIDEVKTEIALLEQKRKPLEVAFNRLLNRDDNLPVTISGTLPEPVTGAAARRDSLIANNPVLAVFDKQIQAAIAEEKVADYMRKPMIGAGLQYMPLVKRKGGDPRPAAQYRQGHGDADVLRDRAHLEEKIQRRRRGAPPDAGHVRRHETGYAERPRRHVRNDFLRTGKNGADGRAAEPANGENAAGH